ncbi:MAG TPA: S8 family serine peptidase [Longimicrobium sp.]|jgi:serine protease|nr:S8 family serine peptidase [Longimicrobium sp.]
MSRFRNPALGVIALAALAACSDTPSSPANQQLIPQIRASSQVDQVVPGEVLVKFRDGNTGTLAARKYASGIRRSGYKHAYEVLAAEPGQERALAAQLAQDPAVEWAEPNYIRHVDAIDSRLWAFFNPGGQNMSFFNDPSGRTGPLPASYASTLDADEDAIEGIAAGGADVVIGSIDTGVDFSHPEFTGRLIAGCDWYAMADAGNASTTCTDFTPNDITTEGHGTHTTGTMAGTTVGVAGITGAGPHVKVYVQRVCGPVGCYTSSIINAIRAAADQPNMVAMNLSLGGTTESAGEKSAISYATGKGVLVIAASGNGGNNKVGCPACDVNAISVGATDWKDVRTSYSQYGTGLDIVAPGGLCYSNSTPEGCVFSSVVSGYTGGTVYTGPLAGGGYTYMNGTSMATPQVTGAAAAVASKTGLRGSALRTRLQSTADDKGAAGVDTQYGNGRLNVYRAVTNTSLGAGL